MWTFERYTESRGRSAVPIILRLTRLRRFSRCWRFFSTTTIVKPPSAGLADLAPDLLVAVANALALVGLRRPHLTDLRRHLAYPLLVYTAHDYRRGVGHLELYALARRDRDRMREPDLQTYVPPLELGPVADARDLQRLREPFGDAGDGVLDQGAGEPVHRLVLGRVRRPSEHEAPVLLPDLDAAPDGHPQFALRTRHLHDAAGDLDVYPSRDLDRRLTDSRHTLLLVHEAEDLAADAHPAGLMVGEDPLRGREDRHSEPVEDAGDVLLLAVDAPARAAHPPEASYCPLPVGAVLQLDHKDLLGPCSLLQEVVYVALLLEDAGNVRLHLRVRDLGRVVLRHLRVADPGQEVRYGIVNRHRSLPTRFRYPGNLALVGKLPEADPAQPELPVVPVCPAAPLAPVVLSDREFLLSLLLYQQG